MTSLTDYIARRGKKAPLRCVLVVPFLLQTVVLVSLLGYFSWRNQQEASNRHASELIQEIGGRVELKLLNYLKTPQQIDQIKMDLLQSGRSCFDNQGNLLQTCMLLKLDSFLKEELHLHNTVQIFIIDRSGFLVASSTSSLPVFIKQGKPQRIQARKSQDEILYSTAQTLQEKFGSLDKIQQVEPIRVPGYQQQQLIHVVPFQQQQDLDWLIVLVMPESSLMGRSGTNARAILLLCISAMMVAIALGLLTTHYITQPILRLSRASRNLALGSWDYPVNESTMIAELEVLTRSFNQMAEQFCQSFEQVKDALHNSEENFTKVFRTSPDPIAIVTFADGRFIEVNDKFLQLLGYEREEVIGRTTLELDCWANLEDRQRVGEAIQAHECVFNLEIEVLTKTGESRMLLLSAEILEFGGTPCVLTVSRDISHLKQAENERKRMELALQESEARYRAIVNSQTEMIVRSTPDTTITFVNETTSRLTGYPPELLIGRSWQDFIHPDHCEMVLGAVANLTPDRPSFTVVERNRLANGQYSWFEWNNRGIFDTDGNLLEIQGVGREIHDRKKLECTREN